MDQPDVMTTRSQRGCQPRVDALVEQRPHPSARATVSSASQSAANACAARRSSAMRRGCAARISGTAMFPAELTQDLLDRDPGAADHRLAEHHGGIDGDAVVMRGLADHDGEDSRSGAARPFLWWASAWSGASRRESPHPARSRGDQAPSARERGKEPRGGHLPERVNEPRGGSGRGRAASLPGAEPPPAAHPARSREVSSASGHSARAHGWIAQRIA